MEIQSACGNLALLMHVNITYYLVLKTAKTLEEDNNYYSQLFWQIFVVELRKKTKDNETSHVSICMIFFSFKYVIRKSNVILNIHI